MDKNNGTTIKTEHAHIRQSIADILQTPIGSRIQRRNYGSILPLLIDRPISHGLALQIAAASIVALQKWEPRIEVSHFNVRFDQIEKTKITADIEAAERRNNNQITFEQMPLML
ncbi:hypothetical protein A1D23_05230 [Chelonobacter oris]|uniref:GPW/gp25 family protein n=1 Tax=Chelonobacter oris TaxID=505317 RepID=UPI00244D0268|nr:GPW/gp25 family protein [Chelonobacter oris]MDH2999496.1 hypothetical protein [Chelonobacter oris]